jgi:hypothetical protein
VGTCGLDLTGQDKGQFWALVNITIQLWFQIRQVISWVTTRLLASQEEIFSVQAVKLKLFVRRRLQYEGI